MDRGLGLGRGRNPFRYGNACSVFDSLLWLEERTPDGGFMVRDIDVAGYLRDLTEGELMQGQDFVGIRLDIQDFAARCHDVPIRWWLNGIGWHCGFRFCVPANGRPFYAQAIMEEPVSGFGV